jgi:uncharacterized protein HemY
MAIVTIIVVMVVIVLFFSVVGRLLPAGRSRRARERTLKRENARRDELQDLQKEDLLARKRERENRS